MISNIIQQQVALGSLVTFYLKSGQSISGKLTEVGLDHITLEKEDQVIGLPIDIVAYWSITKSSAGKQSSQSYSIQQPIVPTTSNIFSAQSTIESDRTDNLIQHDDQVQTTAASSRNDVFPVTNGTAIAAESLVPLMDDRLGAQASPVQADVHDANVEDKAAASGNAPAAPVVSPQPIVATTSNIFSAQSTIESDRTDNLIQHDDQVQTTVAESLVPLMDDRPGAQASLVQADVHDANVEDKAAASGNAPAAPVASPPVSASSNLLTPEQFKRVFSIDAHFSLRLESARLQIATPVLKFPDDNLNYKRDLEINRRWQKIMGMYEYAVRASELGEKFGRSSRIAYELSELVEVMPDSRTMRQYHIHFLILAGDLKRALEIARELVIGSSASSDWYVFAELALRRYGCSVRYRKDIVTA